MKRELKSEGAQAARPKAERRGGEGDGRRDSRGEAWSEARKRKLLNTVHKRNYSVYALLSMKGITRVIVTRIAVLVTVVEFKDRF